MNIRVSSNFASNHSIMMHSHRFVLGLALTIALLLSGDSGFAVVNAQELVVSLCVYELAFSFLF